MLERRYYLNGELVPESGSAKISVGELFQELGDQVVYEVTRTFRGKPFRLREHARAIKLGVGILGSLFYRP